MKKFVLLLFPVFSIIECACVCVCVCWLLEISVEVSQKRVLQCHIEAIGDWSLEVIEKYLCSKSKCLL